MSDIDNLEKRIQQETTDSLGRTYNYSSGRVPQNIEYNDDNETRSIALKICDITDRMILEELIISEMIVFKKSVSGRKISDKPIYIMGLRTSVRCATGVSWSYCIETTKAFELFSQKEKFAIVLKMLKRIPEKEIPSGSFVSFDSYDNYSNELKLIEESL